MALGITLDELVVIINAQTSDFKKQIAVINDQLDGVSKQTSGMSKKSTAAFGVIAGAAQALVSKGINLITSSVGEAVDRFDTIQNFPRVMENFGIKSTDAAKAMQTLVAGVKGLPTPLDSVVNLAEGFVPMTKNIGKAATLATALAHAVAAGGKPMEIQAAAMEQFSQALAKGKPQLQDWKSLEIAMPGQLTQIAKKLGLGSGALKDFSDNGQGLYNAMSAGKISMDDFNKALVDLDNKGLREGSKQFPNFEQQAHNAAGGVGASFKVMKQGIQNGIGDIMKVIGQKNLSNAISNIGTMFKDAFDVIADVIKFIKNNSTVFAPLAAAIGTAAAAMLLWNTYTKLAAIYTAAYTAISSYLTLVMSLQAQGLGIVRAAWMALNIVMEANPIGIIITLVAALVAGLAYFFTQTDTGKKIFKAAMDAIKSAAQAVWDWIKSNWPLLLGILTGPIGIAVVEIIKHWDTVKNTFLAAWNYIKSVWSAVAGWFGGVWNGIKRAFSSVTSWFSSTFRSAWSAVANAFSGVSSFFGGVKNKIVGAFSGIGRSISSFFHNIWGSVGTDLKNAINAVLHLPLTIPKIHIPHVGTIGGETLIPRLAKGGIVDGATLAMVGENGREAIMPLENNTGWIDELAGKIAGRGSSGQPVQIVVKIGEDTIVDKVVKGINNRSFMSNTTVIQV